MLGIHIGRQSFSYSISVDFFPKQDQAAYNKYQENPKD